MASTVQKRRLRGVYLVSFYGPFSKYVGGTRLSVEEPVEKNLKIYVDKWRDLNPWANVRRFTAKREGVRDETGKK